MNSERPASVTACASGFDAVAASSREQMLEHGTRFLAFVKSKNPKADLAVMDERAVNEYLRFFYFTLATKQGNRYSPSSLICIRSGIQRYFEFILGRKIVLPGNPVYMTSNRMLEQRSKEYQESGGCVKHYAPISAQDVELLGDYFNGTGTGDKPKRSCSVEERLQDEVVFTLMYHFGGGQQQQSLIPISRCDLEISVDSEGREFASISSLPGFVAQSPRMYKSVDKLKVYLGMLPDITKDDSLFPRPLRWGKGYSDSCNRGVNYMQNFMRCLSKKAALGQVYSNHSIRLTRMRDLDTSGCSADEIRSVTGHKCGKSVKRCLRWSQASAKSRRARLSPEVDVKRDGEEKPAELQNDNAYE